MGQLSEKKEGRKGPAIQTLFRLSEAAAGGGGCGSHWPWPGWLVVVARSAASAALQTTETDRKRTGPRGALPGGGVSQPDGRTDGRGVVGRTGGRRRHQPVSHFVRPKLVARAHTCAHLSRGRRGVNQHN